jgi:hypothetical protein
MYLILKIVHVATKMPEEKNFKKLQRELQLPEDCEIA